jgi:hypothetical protein
MASSINDNAAHPPIARRFNLARAIGLWSLALLVGAASMFLIQKNISTPDTTASKQHTSNTPPLNVSPVPIEKEPLLYIPPENRSEALQAFDKALLFIVNQQEADGHWSASRTGAEKEFCNPNTDLTLTALSTYTLLNALIGKQPNPALIESSRRGLRWLREKLRADGGIADLHGPGEPVVAQLFCSLVFIQAASMSPLDIFAKQATLTTQYGLLQMTNFEEGFNTRKELKNSRLDVTTLAAFLYRNALTSNIRFSVTKEDIEKFAVELRIEKGIQAVLKKTRIASDKQAGVFRMNSSADTADLMREDDFDATLCALLTQILANLPPKEVSPGFSFILGTPSESGLYPNAGEKLSWGKTGEGYRALPTWFGSLAFAFYGDHESCFRAWSKAFQESILSHQAKDGSWDASGPDARYGRIYRTALTACSLLLLNPTRPGP